MANFPKMDLSSSGWRVETGAERVVRLAKLAFRIITSLLELFVTSQRPEIKVPGSSLSLASPQ